MTQINPDLYDSDPFDMKKSKFGPFKDNRPFIDKVKDFGQSLLFWRGRKKGIVHTRDVEWDDIRYIFFPKDFSEKYGYLGAVPREYSCNQAMVPLVLVMDYEAKPWWCPRWFLRFLDVFGNDKSIVRVRNRTLHNLHRKLTKGITFTDYKTKWEWYDLRISVAAPKYIQDLADAIEDYYYRAGKKVDTIKQIKAIEPTFNKIMVLDDYMDYLNKLQNKRVNNEEGD